VPKDSQVTQPARAGRAQVLSLTLDPSTLSVPVGGALVVWCPSLEHDVAVAVSPVAERERVARLRRPEDRARSLTGAWLLRQVAAAALGVDPAQVAIDRACDCGRQHGRPHVTAAPGYRADGGSPDRAVDLSLTHAGSVVGVACALRGRVGLDVEPRAAFDSERAGEVLDTAATPEEQARARSDPDVALAAGRLWVRKEAVLKATGHGLTQDPRTLSLDPVSGDLTGWPFPEPVTSVHLRDVDPDSAHLGALALIEPVGTLRSPTEARRAAPLVRVLRVLPDIG